MDARPSGYILELRVDNIGQAADLTTPALQLINVTVAGVPCENPRRVQVRCLRDAGSPRRHAFFPRLLVRYSTMPRYYWTWCTRHSRLAGRYPRRIYDCQDALRDALRRCCGCLQVTPRDAAPYTVISCELQARAVGYQNITVAAAGQVSATTPASESANTLLVSSCTLFTAQRGLQHCKLSSAVTFGHQ